MTGTLFVVATPIGNLEDITLRALRVLREADVIAAEDTRRTARLLGRHGIQTPTISFHEHNTRSRVPQLLTRLEAGESVALVTDAGTPSISDPGVELVRACIGKGVAVDSIPGPSAPITAASLSGFPLDSLTVLGFPPARAAERKKWMEALAILPHTVSFFEAPHRIRATLSEAALILGNRQIMVGRELTKIHQELLRGPAGAVLEALTSARGEFTVVVGPMIIERTSPDDASDQTILNNFGHITEYSALGRRDVVRELGRKHRMTTKEVYAAIERAKKSVI